MFPLFLQLAERKVLDPNGPHISTSQTKIRNVCLSVILEFCMLLSNLTDNIDYWVLEVSHLREFLKSRMLLVGKI